MPASPVEQVSWATQLISGALQHVQGPTDPITLADLEWKAGDLYIVTTTVEDALGQPDPALSGLTSPDVFSLSFEGYDFSSFMHLIVPSVDEVAPDIVFDYDPMTIGAANYAVNHVIGALTDTGAEDTVRQSIAAKAQDDMAPVDGYSGMTLGDYGVEDNGAGCGWTFADVGGNPNAVGDTGFADPFMANLGQLIFSMFGSYEAQDMTPFDNGNPGNAIVKSAAPYGNTLAQVTAWRISGPAYPQDAPGDFASPSVPNLGAWWPLAASSVGMGVEINMRPSGSPAGA